MEIRRILQVGKSFCIVVPKEYIEFLKLKRGSYTLLKLAKNKIEVFPLEQYLNERKKHDN